MLSAASKGTSDIPHIWWQLQCLFYWTQVLVLSIWGLNHFWESGPSMCHSCAMFSRTPEHTEPCWVLPTDGVMSPWLLCGTILCLYQNRDVLCSQYSTRQEVVRNVADWHLFTPHHGALSIDIRTNFEALTLHWEVGFSHEDPLSPVKLTSSGFCARTSCWNSMENVTYVSSIRPEANALWSTLNSTFKI